MGVVLCEAAHAGESVQLAALLVAEDGAELCDAQRQVFVGARLAGVDFAVVGAVHGLEHVFLVLFGRVDRLERIFPVVGIVARGNVEALAADAGRDDLLIVVGTQEAAQEFLQAQAQLRALRQPDG